MHFWRFVVQKILKNDPKIENFMKNVILVIFTQSYDLNITFDKPPKMLIFQKLCRQFSVSTFISVELHGHASTEQGRYDCDKSL